MTSVMILLAGAEAEWLINMVLSIFLLALLVDALTFVILLVSFSGLGYCFYIAFLDNPQLDFNHESIYLTVYIIVFASLICLLFGRKREIMQGEKLNNLELIAGSIAHEVRTPMFASLLNADTLNNILSTAKTITHKDDVLIRLSKADYHCIKNIICKNLVSSMRKGDKIIEMLLMSLKYKVMSDDISDYKVSEIIYEAIDEYCLSPQEGERLSIKLNDDFTVHGSKLFLKHLLMNLLKNAYKYAGKTACIVITTKDGKLFFKDNGVGIPEDSLDKIFDRFYTSSSSGTGVGLAFCQMVMKSINGSITCNSIFGKETEFILEFPTI
jgi:signal transduction histidine kinase